MRTRKNKGYKIPKYDRIFDGSSHRKKIKTRNTIIFILVLALLVFIGYSIAGPLSNLLKGEKTDLPSSSSQISSQIADVSSQISSEEKLPEIDNLSCAYLPLETARDADKLASFLDTIKSRGYNAVVLQLKDEVGKIYFDSKNEMAVEVSAVSDTKIENLSEVVKTIKDAAVTPIAQIHAFKDRIATKKADAKIKYKGNPEWSWLDAENGKPWLNPYSSVAKKYVTDVALELTDLGFENVMVSSVMFPPVYSYSLADFGEGEKTVSHKDVLANFTMALKKALNDKKANLILNYDATFSQDPQNKPYGTADAKDFDADLYCADITEGYLGVEENKESGVMEIILANFLKGFENGKKVMINLHADNKESAQALKELCKEHSYYLSSKTQIF